MADRRIAVVLAASLLGTGCFGRHGGLGLFEAALITAVVVSALEPPAPRVIIVPAAREGYVWQAGYWTRQDDQWVWVDGQWLQQRPSFEWAPTHWQRMGDGSWQLVPGQWVAA